MRNDVTLLLARVERAAPDGDARLAMGAPRPAARAAASEGAHH
jgi:NADH-quinone oxidoreductase subunit M